MNSLVLIIVVIILGISIALGIWYRINDIVRKYDNDVRSREKEMEPYFEDYEDEFDEDDNQEPDYYYCTFCNHTQIKPGMGNGCDNCGLFNVMEEGYF